MAKIAIDLLPIEFRAQDLKRAKFYKIQTIGVGVILLMIFLSSLTIALRILQSQQDGQIQSQLNQSEGKISNLKKTQASLELLKNRLTTINQYLGNPPKQAEMYKFIDKQLPKSVSVSSIAIDKTGEVSVIAIASDGKSLDNLTTNLLSKETNEDKIKEVSFETINRGRDGIYRLTFKVKPK